MLASVSFYRDQSCYDIIPLYNAMKKKVLSDSDEVSGCVLGIGIDTPEKPDCCLSCGGPKYCFQSLLGSGVYFSVSTTFLLVSWETG